MFPEQGLLGLRKTENDEGVVDCNQMRQEIERAAYDSSLIRRVFMSARHNGLSGEDKYTMLAYHALKQLQTHYQMNIDWLMKTPATSMIIKTGAGG